MSASGLKVEINDHQITRYRPMLLIADDNLTGATGYQRAMWEMQRNNAESQRITVTVQGWQNSNGSLWLPNELVTLDAPELGIHQEQRLIVDCRYTLDESGSKTTMTLMHRDAFNEPPEPNKNKAASKKQAQKSKQDKVPEFTGYE